MLLSDSTVDMKTLLLGLFLFWTLAAFGNPADAETQSDIDYLAKNLGVQYEVVNNFEKFDRFLAQVTFTNQGATTIKTGEWSIYLCIIYMAEPDHLRHNPSGYVLPGEPGLKFTHVDGCLHKLEPTKDFRDIPAGESLSFQYNSSYWSVSRTDVMPRWYVAAEGLEAKTLEATDDENLRFVEDFVTKQQWKRYREDRYDPYTPQERFQIDRVADLGKAPLSVIPTAVEISGEDESRKVSLKDEGWKIYPQKGLEAEAEFLAAKTGLTVSSSMLSSKVVKLSLGAIDVAVDGEKSASKDAYSLQISAANQTILVTGASSSGVFCGVQTLLSLMNSDGVVTQLSVKDAPRYEYRGMELDVSRNFRTKDEILKLLDAMAMYKLNKFHFHLTDDEGWRLQIPGLEELTTVGAKRCHDLKGKKCILSQLGSGPSTTTSGSGFYTTAEYQEILQRANKLHIQVIPEFDMPGHGNAAVKAMLARYEKLKQANDPEATKHLLTDLDDNSKYLSVQYFTDNAINPCMESTYTFVKDLVAAIVDLHNDTQPLTIFHFGGDEVAKGAWTNSSECRDLAGRLGLNYSGSGIVQELKAYFVQRVANVTSEYGLDLAGWEDGLTGEHDVPYRRDSLANKRVYGYAWNNIWEWGGGKRAYDLANAGYKVVMSQATHLYFDHPQEPDPEERGYYWATRFTPVRKVFGFMPDDLFANVDVERSGKPITREGLCKNPKFCVDLKKKENIIGMAGALWSETVRTDEQMHSMVFPRLLALAERAWHKASWESIQSVAERDVKRQEDWERFANTLGYKELSRLDQEEIRYYLPPPGARFDGNALYTRTAFPGLKVQYSKDGGKTWQDLQDGEKVTDKFLLGTTSADGNRMSRQMSLVGPPQPSGSAHAGMTSCLLLVALIASFFL